MMANIGNPAFPQWRDLYQAALLEIDLNKLPQRIAEAECAIMDSIEDLNRSSNGSESQALMNALNVLRDLHKIADGDSQTRK